MRLAGLHTGPGLLTRRPSLNQHLSSLDSPRARIAARIVAIGLLAFLIASLLLVAVGTAPSLFGFHTYTVSENSMGSALSTRSIAVTKPTSVQALAPGDIVAYQPPGESRARLHRILEIKTNDGERRFVMQANDGTVVSEEPIVLTGKGDRLVYSVPFAGYLLGFAGSVFGQIVLIGAPLAILAAMFLRDRGEDRGESQDQEELPLADLAAIAPVETAPERAAVALASEESARPPETIRLHEVPLLKMVPLATALEMAHEARRDAKTSV